MNEHNEEALLAIGVLALLAVIAVLFWWNGGLALILVVIAVCGVFGWVMRQPTI